MKNVKGMVFLLIVVTTATGIFFESCKKDSEDPNLTYLKDFYGVGVVHSFTCLDPTNDSKSLQVDLVWDDKGVATYTTKEIPRDTVNEHNSRLFMPASEFDSETGNVSPTKSVKTIMLVYHNGTIEPVDNYNCDGYWIATCKYCGGAGTIIREGLNSWVVCGGPNPQPPYCYATWMCVEEYDALIGWQTY